MALAALSVAAGPGFVRGHEGGPRLILEPHRIQPGGVLTIRLEDLPPERPVDLSIAGAGGSVPLASVIVDPEGHATVFVEIPVDLPVGAYSVNATAEATAVPGVQVTVEGPPLVEAGKPGEKDEDDLLLVALPSGWQQSLSGPIVTAKPLTETMPAGSGSRGAVQAAVAAVALMVALGSLALVGWSRRGGRRS